MRWCAAAVAGCVAACLAIQPAQAKVKHRHTAAHAQAAKPALFSGAGFDACHAPPLATMRTWWLTSGYQAVGVYIGGVNRACSDGNLSHAWVKAVSAIGWRFVPVYVGQQAPCSHQPHLKLIDPEKAAAQGSAAADDAMNRAAAFGMARGSTVYFDLESYARKNPACTGTVLSYLGAWTKRLHAHNYFSGFYSSAGSGITDLVKSTDRGLARPDALWIARWDNAHTVNDRAVPDGAWAVHQRIKQYAGGHKEQHGGATLSVDSDWLDGPVARIG